MWKVYIEYRIPEEKDREFRDAIPSAKERLSGVLGGHVSGWEIWEGWDQPGLFVEEILCDSLPAALAVRGAAAGDAQPLPRVQADEQHRAAAGEGAGLSAGQQKRFEQWARRREELGASRLHSWIFVRR
ncbi:MAG: hypothetical protein IRY98_08190 [Alicyclobacillaceae bacterium]|nr:hypothetical protein [Alicyclobacillaceae bacterium]